MSPPDFQLSFTMKSMWIYFHIFLAIWTSCNVTSVTGQHQVKGSSQAVQAKVGDDVTLPCYIEPPRNATRMTVQWSRPDLKIEFVHLLQDGREVSDVLNHFYKGRTSLFAEKLPQGNISLKLSGVQLSDAGKYKCDVPTLHSSHEIQLDVEDITGTEKSDCMTGGAIAGIVIAVAALAAILGYFLHYLEISRKRQNTPSMTEEEHLPLNTVPSVAKHEEVDLGVCASQTDAPCGPPIGEPCTTATNEEEGPSINEEEGVDPNIQHPGVECGCCQMKPIVGTRYKCTVCPNYDLCSACQSTGLHKEHGLRSIQSPQEANTVARPQKGGEAMNEEIDLAPQLIAGPRDDDIQAVVHDEQYELTSRPTGLCVIMYNNVFKSLKPRTGTDKDIVDVATRFSWLGFRVLRFENQIRKEMLKSLKHFSSLEDVTELQKFNVKEWSSEEEEFTELNANKPLQHGDAFVCYINSRGTMDCVLGTDVLPLHIDKIITPFNGVNCPALVNKPKLFLIEAAQGHGDQDEEYSPVNEDADVLVIKGSKEKSETFVNRINGSWFTQAMCKQLQKGCPRGDNLVAIFSEVQKNVMTRCHKEEPGRGIQIPVVRNNTLTKNVVYSPISN